MMSKKSIAPIPGSKILVAALACLVLGAVPAQAQPTIEWLGNCFPSDISADGSVIAGNTADGNYETFRWTPDAGLVPLGQSTGAVFGTGGGTPDISDDGNRVSATVVNADSTYSTQGIWTKGEGWSFAMPPIPDDGGILDDQASSCWGLSGDGLTTTGFYWRPGASDGTAHCNTWSLVDGFNPLGSPVGNSRGNDLNYDGSVVVGWSARPDGVWCPTVWENGTIVVLQDQEYWCTAEGVTNDGNIIYGQAYNADTNQVEAALWLRSDSGWDLQTLGVLPGTFPGYGQAQCNDMTETGPMIIVGYNEFNWGDGTGFVWTLEQGMISGEDYLISEGFVLPETFTLLTLTAISHNGAVLTGFGWDDAQGGYVGFRAIRENVSAAPEGVAVMGLRFEGNFPNPFNPSTEIALAVDQTENIQLDVYDVAGRLVRKLHDGVLTQGPHRITWDGRNDSGALAASGVYFAQVRDREGQSASHRMMLVK
jgi:hypothetical protein